MDERWPTPWRISIEAQPAEPRDRASADTRVVFVIDDANGKNILRGLDIDLCNAIVAAVNSSSMSSQ